MGKRKENLKGMEFTNHKGLRYRVIEEIDEKCVISFIESGSTQLVRRERVRTGLISDNSFRKAKYGRKDLVPGVVLKGKYNEEFEVLESVGHQNCQDFFKIRFLKSGNKAVCAAQNILRSCVCDLDASIEEKSLKKINGRVFVGISPTGQQYISSNQRSFAIEHGLDQGNISGCLVGRIVTHKGWKFRYLNDLIDIAHI